MIVEFLGRNLKKYEGEMITSIQGLKKLRKKMLAIDEFAFDTETNTLRVKHPGEMQLVGISISWGEHNNYYIPTGHFFDEDQLTVKQVRKYLKDVFERDWIRIIGQNLKFDLHVLANIGICIKTTDIFCTQVARWLTNENVPKGLKEMTNSIYGIPQTHFDECLATVTNEEKKLAGLKANNKATFSLVRASIGAPYAIADAYWTWRHYCDWCMEELKNESMELIYKKHMKFLLTLFNMERRGVNVDLDRLKNMAEMAVEDLEDLEYKIAEMAGVVINPSSGQQIAELLFGYRKLNKQGEFVGNENILAHSYKFPIQKVTPTGAPKTGDEELANLLKLEYKKDKKKMEGQKLIKLLRKFKKLKKLKSAFIDGLIEGVYPDGKIHCSFNQTGTDSGRLSCSDPNLQQLPRPVELHDPMTPEDFLRDKFKLSDEEMEGVDFSNIREALEYEYEYPTGELTCPIEELAEEPEFIGDYLSYLKDWRAKNEESIFWKRYEIRSCFISDDPENEVIIAQDYSNLEMRLLAHFSKDPNLVETFTKDHDKRCACRG